MGYRFVMSNALVIISLAFVLGHPSMAAAEDLYGNEFQFDEQRLVFDQQEDIQFEQDQTGLSWNGSGSYGSLTYDVSSTTSISVSVFTGDFFSNVCLFYDGTQQHCPTKGQHTFNDLDGVNELEVRISTQQAALTDLEGLDSEIGVNDYISQSNIREKELETQEGFFATATAVLNAAISVVTQLPGVLIAWGAFALAIPGAAGFFFKSYIAVFVIYLIVTEIWVG